MKNLIWTIAALSATAAYMLVKSAQAKRPVPVDELAHKLESAWAKNHTVV
jgi:hypothetical protein